jgi:kynureninase
MLNPPSLHPDARQPLLAQRDADYRDESDPLRSLRDSFDMPRDVLYLCGNSLGPMPVAAGQRGREVVEQQWARDLIRSWNVHDWFGLPERVGARIARLIGARAHEVIVADSTSINLFKAVHAALKLRPKRRAIVAETGNFPTDAYVLQGIARESAGAVELRAVARERVSDAIDEETAVVVLTHAHFLTSELFDLEAVTRKAHSAGALVVWDLSHSVGAVPVELDAANADFAVGCTYKYLNGGPGSPAFIFAAERHHAAIDPGMFGWWGHQKPFELLEDYQPAAGMRRTLTGTASILALSVLDAALDVWDGLDIRDLRQKSIALSSAFIALVEQKCAGLGISLITPQDPARRGSHVALRHENGYAVMQALIARNVVGDFRAPDVIRFGIAPLYTRFRDVWNTVEILADVLGSGEWRKAEFTRRGRVT